MWTELLLTILALVGVGYFLVKKRYSHWADRGIPHEEPTFPFGTMKGVGTKFHASELHKRVYDKYKGRTPIVGMFTFVMPVLVITDMELVKNILVKDFHNFVNRGVYYNEKDDPLSAHLFSMEDNKWRSLRAKLTPTFTSGKMKFMFPTIVSVAEEFKKCINGEILKNNEIEMKDILARFTTDVIGTCAFGVDCNSLKDPEAEFRVMGRKVFDLSPLRLMRFLLLAGFQKLGKTLGFAITDKKVAEFFLGVCRDTIAYRETNNVQRNDFMDLLIKLKNEGQIDNDQGKVGITFNEIAAQAFIFFGAGFETSSTTMSFALYELSLNQEIQEKGRQEVQRVLQKHNGQMTYEAIAEMKYIDQIINESLRKYPPAAALLRIADKDYKVPDTNYIIEKGRLVFIPAYAIQNDPEYYPIPENFDPDRFSEEEVKNRNPYTFLPFGEGPRICIGLRFGMMQARIGLATLLVNYKFSRCSKSIVPMSLLPNGTVLTIAGGLWLDVKKL